jgi:hypothetical protein
MEKLSKFAIYLGIGISAVIVIPVVLFNRKRK